MRSPLKGVAAYVTHSFEEVGRFVATTVEVFKWTLRPPYRAGLLVQQMETIGVKSLFVVFLTAAFTGLVMVLQTTSLLAKFQAEGLVGSSVALAVTRELGPVFTALMVTGRAGSAMATELGTMRVTEQIDALSTMAVNPVQYLIVPRVIASMLMMPVLAAIFDVVSFFGSYVMGVWMLGIDQGVFVARTRHYLDPIDITSGLYKAVVFGAIVALISCDKGFRAEGGAKGVGEATTKAVVVSSVAILIADYFLNVLMTNYLPGYLLGGPR
ncbi:MAG: ABC transporter permease [Deltaproteobacteria bacterium]|nr:ABC transporter permease [Deltaproteobacteria bacterium]